MVAVRAARSAGRVRLVARAVQPQWQVPPRAARVEPVRLRAEPESGVESLARQARWARELELEAVMLGRVRQARATPARPRVRARVVYLSPEAAALPERAVAAPRPAKAARAARAANPTG